jgi:hypothetical protein
VTELAVPRQTAAPAARVPFGLAFTVIDAVEVGTAEQVEASTKLVKLTVLAPTFRLPAGMLMAVPLVILVKLTELPLTESVPEKGEVPAEEVNVTELAKPWQTAEPAAMVAFGGVHVVTVKLFVATTGVQLGSVIVTVAVLAPVVL